MIKTKVILPQIQVTFNWCWLFCLGTLVHLLPETSKIIKYPNLFTMNVPSKQSLTYFSPSCPKAKFEKLSIYSNKFIHRLHLSETNFTCPELRASGLARRLADVVHTKFDIYDFISTINKKKPTSTRYKIIFIYG
jgi:hypothetical protein